EEISGGFVVVFVARIDSPADVGRVDGIAVDQGAEVLRAINDVNRILRQWRARSRHAYGSQGQSAQSGNPLGDHIDEGENLFGQLIEEFMELKEIRPLDIPAGLLDLRIEVGRLRQAFVQQFDEGVAILFWDVDMSGKCRLRGLGCWHTASDAP